jgi:hypothetical protein
LTFAKLILEEKKVGIMRVRKIITFLEKISYLLITSSSAVLALSYIQTVVMSIIIFFIHKAFVVM